MFKRSKEITAVVLVLIVLFFILKEANCQKLDELKEILQRQDLHEITNLLDKTRQWPEIVSVQGKERLSSDEQQYQQEALQLAKILLVKIEGFEKKHEKVDLNSLRATTETYAKLGKILKNKQGYSNLVLTETVYRLALSRLGFFLVNNPDKYEQVYRLWGEIERPCFNVSNLVNILEDEVGISSEKIEIERFALGSNIQFVFGRLLSQHLEAQKPDEPTKMLSRSFLLKNMYGYDLFIMYMSETDTMLELSIPGMVAFLRRGGNLEVIKENNMEEFQTIMAGFEILQSKFRGEAGPHLFHLQSLINEFSEDLKTSNFYRAAISVVDPLEIKEKHREKLERKLNIAKDDNESPTARWQALVSIMQDKEILIFPEFKKTFEENLWALIKKNRREDFGIVPLDALGALSSLYAEPPSKEQQNLFLELLADDNNSPIVRSTCAFYLRNTRDPEVIIRVEHMAEKLLEKYQLIPDMDTRVVGRLKLTLREISR